MNDYLDCYIRVSTAEQEKKGSSLDSQEHIGKKVASRLGLKFRLRNEGARSSVTQYRPVLSELKEDIERGLVKHVWSFDRSRLFRDFVDAGFFKKEYLEQFGVNLYEGESATLRTYENPDEELLDDILSRLQQYENEKRRYRSEKGKQYLLENVSKRKPVFLGGTATFGFKNVNKEWTINKEEAAWVRFMFDSVIDGRSTRWIKSELDRAGVKPRRTRNGLWSLGTIQKMLGNESYTGDFHWHSKATGKSYSYRIPQIVDAHTFKRVQGELKKRRKLNNNRKKHFSLLEEFMECECGTMIGSQVKKGIRKNGAAYNTKTYYCVSKLREWKDGIDRGCKNKLSMNMDKTNEELFKLVQDIVGNSVLLKEKFKREVLEKKLDDDEQNEIERGRLTRKSVRLSHELDRTIDNIAIVETDLLQEKREKQVAERVLSNLKKERELLSEEHEKTLQGIADLDERKEWLDWLEMWGQRLELFTEEETSKKHFLKQIVEKIVVKSEFGNSRDGKAIQVGHSFDVHFKMKIVGDELRWCSGADKSKGYEIREGTEMFHAAGMNVCAAKGRKKKPS